MKLSFITTVYNEEHSIETFLQSLFKQTRMPDEIVIVDGGSTDDTVKRIKDLRLKYNEYKGKFLLLIKKGNRSVGRNEAIRSAKGEIIVCSDAGCILDSNWVKNISTPFLSKKIDVVSGFYKPVTKNVFEKCLSVYTSVMPDKLNPLEFLPSSRSIAFRKSAWEKVGGYPQELDTCEDLVFDRKLKKKGLHFIFEKNAFVYWPQQHTLKKAFFQFYGYAKGDGQAMYIRPQTPFLFLRYMIGMLLVIIYFVTKIFFLLILIFLILIIYCIWAIIKNYRYIKNIQALYFLPLLQFISDIAVLIGFTKGIVSNFKLLQFN